jgi:hypothetical protein
MRRSSHRSTRIARCGLANLAFLAMIQAPAVGPDVAQIAAALDEVRDQTCSMEIDGHLFELIAVCGVGKRGRR